MTYSRSAPYYDLLYGFKDYEAASADINSAIRARAPNARSLLDVACGTGRHLEHLRSWYEVEGLDINPQLLTAAKARCPGVRLYEADMIDFDLARRFDVVACLFSSIAYAKTVDNLGRAVASMRRHLEPGGVLVLEPWFTPENYWTGTITANHVDDPKIKISWMYTSEEPDGNLAVLDINYLVGTPVHVEHFTERHELGLFTDEQYRSTLENCGLEVAHHLDGPFGRGLYLGCA